MKKTIIPIISLLILASCSKKVKLDRNEVKSVSEYLIQTIQNRDTLSFLKLFDYELDPKFTDSIPLKNLNLESFGSAYETFKGKDVKFISYNTKDGLAGGEIIDDKSLNIYVKVDESFYKLRLTHHTAKKENYFLLFDINDLSSECESIKDKPFSPSRAMLSKRLNWESLNGNVFYNVNAVFTNFLPYDIEKIKFRLTIENSEKIILKQTFISEKPIYEGDISAIPIEDLNGVYAGFSLERGNFDWNIEVLEVEPKPEFNPCARIQTLGEKK